MTTRKTIALTRWTFVGKVVFQLFDMLSKLVIAFLPRSKHLLVYGFSPWVGKIPWRREWQTTSVLLPLEPHEQYEKPVN